jgi:hypothetical protein
VVSCALWLFAFGAKADRAALAGLVTRAEGEFTGSHDFLLSHMLTRERRDSLQGALVACIFLP